MNRSPNSELGRRTKQFATDVVLYSEKIKPDHRGRNAQQQLVRSSTSVGANYVEACQARSRKEFVSKASISLQEAEEARYWLDLVRNTKLGPYDEGTRLSDECHEIIKMLAATVKTAKQRGAP